MGCRGSSSGGGGGGGNTYGGANGRISQSSLDSLIDMGANRWTKGDNDRLYLKGAGDRLVGLEVDTYKSGSISYAELSGERISNRTASQLRDTYSRAYINLKDGSLNGLGNTPYKDLFTQKMKKYIKKR